MRAFTRLFADAPPAEMADAIQKGLAEALQVSVPIPGRHHVRNIAQARNGRFEIVKSLGAIEPNEAIVSNNAQFGGGAAAE